MSGHRSGAPVIGAILSNDTSPGRLRKNAAVRHWGPETGNAGLSRVHQIKRASACYVTDATKLHLHVTSGQRRPKNRLEI